MTEWAISDWQEWLAWYPVKVFYYEKLPLGGTIRVYKLVWLKKIWRRRMLSIIPTGDQCLYWQYKDKNIFDILKDS